MLSGVGPQAHLEKLGIHVVKNHPNVGQNLVDHPVIDVYFKDKHDQSAKFLRPKSLSDAVKLFQEVSKYRAGVPGSALAMNVSSFLVYIESDSLLM